MAADEHLTFCLSRTSILKKGGKIFGTITKESYQGCGWVSTMLGNTTLFASMLPVEVVEKLEILTHWSFKIEFLRKGIKVHKMVLFFNQL